MGEGGGGESLLKFYALILFRYMCKFSTGTSKTPTPRSKKTIYSLRKNAWIHHWVYLFICYLFHILFLMDLQQFCPVLNKVTYNDCIPSILQQYLFLDRMRSVINRCYWMYYVYNLSPQLKHVDIKSNSWSMLLVVCL